MSPFSCLVFSVNFLSIFSPHSFDSCSWWHCYYQGCLSKDVLFACLILFLSFHPKISLKLLYEFRYSDRFDKLFDVRTTLLHLVTWISNFTVDFGIMKSLKVIFMYWIYILWHCYILWLKMFTPSAIFTPEMPSSGLLNKFTIMYIWETFYSANMPSYVKF